MSLSHVTKLEIDFVLTTFLSRELGRKSLETTTPSLVESVLVSEGFNGKTRDVSNNGKGKGKFNLKSDIKCYYYDKVSYIMK